VYDNCQRRLSGDFSYVERWVLGHIFCNTSRRTDRSLVASEARIYNSSVI
jgi:hypothetical protein